MRTRSAAVLTTVLLAVPGVAWSAPAADVQTTRIVTVSRQPDGGLDVTHETCGAGRSQRPSRRKPRTPTP